MKTNKILLIFLVIAVLSLPNLMICPNSLNFCAINQEMHVLGSENDQVVTLTCEKNENLINYNSINDFSLSYENWTLTQTNLNFIDIYSPLFEKVVASGTTSGQSFDYLTSMRFPISDSAYLTELSILLTGTGMTDGLSGLSVRIFNATWDSVNEVIRPFTSIIHTIYGPTNFILSNQLGVSGDFSIPTWINVTLASPLYLDTSKTDNNSFFISLIGNGFGTLTWWGVSASNDNTFQYLSGSWQNYEERILNDRDFSLKIDLAEYSPYPSEINMQVNGMDVTDGGSPGTGYLSITENLMGPEVTFDVTADSTINYDVNYDIFLQEQIEIIPTSEVLSNGDTEWTMSFEAIFPIDSYNREIQVSIGEDWTSTLVYVNSEEYLDVSVDYNNNLVTIYNIISSSLWEITSLEENTDPVPESPKHWWFRWFFWFFWMWSWFR